MLAQAPQQAQMQAGAHSSRSVDSFPTVPVSTIFTTSAREPERGVSDDRWSDYGDGRTPEMWDMGAQHYAPPTRGHS
jgi:hypothetical protein